MKPLNPMKLVVDTDVVLDHLRARSSPSVLRTVMREVLCYTTVFNAVELFGRVRNAAERRAVVDALGAMKILGLNAKTAPGIGAILRKGRRRPLQAVLIGGLCKESRLALLTGRPEQYRGIRGLVVIPSRGIRPGRRAAEILRRARARQAGVH
jgi:predicted nucleic acid-binding protein